MENSKKLLIGLIFLLILGNVYFVTQCLVSRAQLRTANQIIKNQQVNQKTLFFYQLFVEKVLSGQKEVSFDDRLQLENAVRDIGDAEIFSQWQKFVKGGAPEEVQKSLYELLRLLIKKVY